MALHADSFPGRIQLVLILGTICLLLGRQSFGQPPYPRYLCPDNGNYTTNSTYESNLRLLLRSLPDNGTAPGYADATIGEIPDRVYGLVLCRGDVPRPDCRTCLEAATSDILQFCPNSKSAIVWYERCLLRYANQLFLGTSDSRQLRDLMFNVNNVSVEAAPAFNASRWEVLSGLARYAVGNASARPPMFAAGEKDLRPPLGLEGITTLYGLVQCTQDISRDDCGKCLQNLFDFLPVCCPRRIGAVVLAASCNIRYEPYPYYNWSSRLIFPPLQTEAPAAFPPLASRAPLPGGNNATTGVAGNTGKKSRTGIVVAIILPIGIAFLIFVILGWILVKKRVRKGINKGDELIGDFESVRFDLSTIRTATSNFAPSNILGRGGFGHVYKGLLSNGKQIAVKRLLKTSEQGFKELRNEVVLLANLQHRNLVRILGVCLEGEEQLLVYEYIENRSLDTFLFDPIKKEHLTWERRYKIIKGIARGLLYLHEESQIRIIHRDLKVSNILIDADMNPKISDFGLAKLFEEDKTHASTRMIAGTIGYMSPEYAMRGQFSVKSDVFSFGVLVLEIITGRKITDFLGDETPDLLSYVWAHWSTGAAFEILDKAVARSCSLSEVYRCIQVGLLCLQELPANRPTMASIILMLDSDTTMIQNPGKPAMVAGFSATGGLPMNDSSASQYEPSKSLIEKSMKNSENSNIVGGMEPR